MSYDAGLPSTEQRLAAFVLTAAETRAGAFGCRRRPSINASCTPGGGVCYGKGKKMAAEAELGGGRNRRRRGGGARRRKRGNGERALKLPSRQRLPWDEGHARFGGQTCFSAGLARANADTGKNICGPRADVESRCSPVSAENCILAVIMPFWRICGIC
jgi:hypothetical protein